MPKHSARQQSRDRGKQQSQIIVDAQNTKTVECGGTGGARPCATTRNPPKRRLLLEGEHDHCDERRLVNLPPCVIHSIQAGGLLGDQGRALGGRGARGDDMGRAALGALRGLRGMGASNLPKKTEKTVAAAKELNGFLQGFVEQVGQVPAERCVLVCVIGFLNKRLVGDGSRGSTLVPGFQRPVGVVLARRNNEALSQGSGIRVCR